MFKKMRNRLLITNTLIIAALVVGSFSVIYAVTARNIRRDIVQRLDREINITHTDREPRRDKIKNLPDKNPQGEQPPDEQPPDDIRRGNEEIRQSLSLTFTVVTDADGNIVKVSIPFELDEDFYSDKMGEIISNKKEIGVIKSGGGVWAYKTLPSDGEFITAFTECHADSVMLRNLFLALLAVGICAVTAAFLIGLFTANKSIKPVEESYNKQKQFVADASHELKTPLTTINTNIDVLLSHSDSTIGEERKWLGYIKDESERMTKLTNDLLYLARLDHSDADMLLCRVSFSEAAENVILLMEAAVFENKVSLAYDIELEIYVNGSAEQLRQLVMILLDNAIKYTPEGGDIKITLAKEGSDAVLRVRNSGEGISEEAQKQIFERFYRADSSRSRESGGYGLGLAIAKAITDACRGSIRVSSEKNKYTEFAVKIPAVK